jgi:hypothetical protein
MGGHNGFDALDKRGFAIGGLRLKQVLNLGNQLVYRRIFGGKFEERTGKIERALEIGRACSFR